MNFAEYLKSSIIPDGASKLMIIGLGNPGKEYEKTRHNAGFIFVDTLAERLKSNNDMNLIIGDWQFDKYLDAEILEAKSSAGEIAVIIVKPALFMNRSGEVATRVMKRFVPTVVDNNFRLVVVYDDLDIKLGEYKICYEKSPKGHKGISDIISRIGSKDILHVRIGIDSRDAQRRVPGDVYVLEKMIRKDEDTLISAIEKILEDV